MNISDAVQWGSTTLAAAGVDSSRNDSQMLAAHTLGLSKSELTRQIAFGLPYDAEALTSFQALIYQRAQRIPLQHLTGKAPFRYLELQVGNGVFIPRPETETVAGAGIDWLNSLLQHRRSQNDLTPAIAVDLCTGSAAIALAIATECHPTKVYAVELDDLAYQWAQTNIANLTNIANIENTENKSETITLWKGDARTALPELNGQVDLVISNPPYVPPSELPPDTEVNRYDPSPALYGGGVDGLEIPRGIVAAAARLLKPGGLLVMEHGDNQGPAVSEMAGAAPFSQVQIHQDLTNRDRCVTAIRAPHGLS